MSEFRRESTLLAGSFPQSSFPSSEPCLHQGEILKLGPLPGLDEEGRCRNFARDNDRNEDHAKKNNLFHRIHLYWFNGHELPPDGTRRYRLAPGRCALGNPLDLQIGRWKPDQSCLLHTSPLWRLPSRIQLQEGAVELRRS
jgi:hypothetical protein